MTPELEKLMENPHNKYMQRSFEWQNNPPKIDFNFRNHFKGYEDRIKEKFLGKDIYRVITRLDFECEYLSDEYIAKGNEYFDCLDQGKTFEPKKILYISESCKTCGAFLNFTFDGKTISVYDDIDRLEKSVVKERLEAYLEDRKESRILTEEMGLTLPFNECPFSRWRT